jgi:hypothetical protein
MIGMFVAAVFSAAVVTLASFSVNRRGLRLHDFAHPWQYWAGFGISLAAFWGAKHLFHLRKSRRNRI